MGETAPVSVAIFQRKVTDVVGFKALPRSGLIKKGCSFEQPFAQPVKYSRGIILGAPLVYYYGQPVPSQQPVGVKAHFLPLVSHHPLCS